jgi:ADP-ribose pyrophosphatase YjhB (NUDIX family)
MKEKIYSYKYPRPAVTTDCVIFGFDGIKQKVLLIERSGEPYKGCGRSPADSCTWMRLLKRAQNVN